MTLAQALLAIVLPVFLIVAAGYGTVRVRFFPDAGVDALSRFATGIAVPCLLFRAMYELDLRATMRLEHMVSFYGASLAVFVAGALFSRRLFHRRPGEAVASGFCALFGNSVMLGIPIMERAFGAEALAAMYALIAFHVPIFYGVGILAMETVQSSGGGLATAARRTARALLSNPLLAGLALGLGANLAGLPLPEPIQDAVRFFANAALPVALFALGGVLTRYTLKAEVGEALTISVLSIIVCPALAWLLAGPVFGLSEPFVRAAVLMTAMPPGINGYIFAAMYNRAVGTAASTVILGTPLSLLTTAAWIAALGGGAG